MHSSTAARDPAPDDFDAIFFAHAGRLVRLASLLGAQDPEDVVQEAFTRVFSARRRVRDNHRAYLNRAVVNEVRDRARRASVARRDQHLLVVPDGHTPIYDAGDRHSVLEALRELPPRQREALVLRFWLDLPLAEIATSMDVREGTVKSQISRGLATLHAALSDDEEDRA